MRVFLGDDANILRHEFPLHPKNEFEEKDLTVDGFRSAPSDEGAVFCKAKDWGRDSQKSDHIRFCDLITFSTKQTRTNQRLPSKREKRREAKGHYSLYQRRHNKKQQDKQLPQAIEFKILLNGRFAQPR